MPGTGSRWDGDLVARRNASTQDYTGYLQPAQKDERSARDCQNRFLIWKFSWLGGYEGTDLVGTKLHEEREYREVNRSGN